MSASVIMVCFRKGARAPIVKTCLSSLLDCTSNPYELCLIDNTMNNRGLGAARNAAIRSSSGEYIAIVDDDILFNQGWLRECIALLEKYPEEKLIATPIHTPIPGHKKHEQPSMDGNRVNLRSGSNCMVMRRSSFYDIGEFINVHPAKDGVEFCDRQVRKGYKVIMTKEALAVDMAYRQHSYTKEGTT